MGGPTRGYREERRMTTSGREQGLEEEEDGTEKGRSVITVRE